MISINRNIQSEILMTTMEEIVPEDSLFRKVDKYIDFTFIYEEVKDLYCENNGRPSCDPVVLFKLVFIQALDGLKSMRQTCKKIKVDAEYRWFLGIPYGTDTPHFSTFSKNYERRFKDSDVFEKIFINIVKQAIKYHLVDGTTFYTDSTHKKANANKNKYDEITEKYGMLNDEFFMDSTHRKANANKNKYEDKIVKQIKKRKLDLEEEINEERERLGEKLFEYKDEYEEKHIKESKTDPESGYYHRDNKEKGFMYLEHRTVNGKCNIITDAYVTKGNVHDSSVCTERLDYQKNKLNLDINKVGLDSGYDTIDIKKYFEREKIFGVIQYRSYGQGKTEIRKYEFKYLKEEDCYVCPRTGIILPYKNIDKLGYKKYCDRKACEACPFREKCCGKSKYRTIRRIVCEEVNERARQRRLSKEGKQLFKKRKTTVERSFGDSKQNHGYRFTLFKGVEKNQAYTHLICAAQNIKNIAIKRYNIENNNQNITKTTDIFKKISNFIKNLLQTKTSVLKNWGLSTI